MPEPENATQIRPLAATLQEIDKGRLHQYGSEKLHDLIAACLATGKGGTFTLSIKVGVDSADDRRLTVSGSVAAKLPQPEARKSIFFADGDGNLTRKDPSQLEFDVSPVRSVPVTTTEKAAR